MAWDSCQECGFADLTEIEPFRRAYCPRCGALHAFDDDDGWFSLSATYEGWHGDKIAEAVRKG